jgi:hypothetical protein
MDNANLELILGKTGTRQFWLKPFGIPGLPVNEREHFTSPMIRVNFSKNPSALSPGDILIVFRIGASKLAYIGEALSTSFKATDEEIRKESWRAQWSWSIEVRNLSPEYGARWSRYSLKPFTLEKIYNQRHAGEKVKLGSLKFGSDKLRISDAFGKFLVNEIMRL